MKKFLLLTSIFITEIATANPTHYISAKIGVGDTTIYIDGDTKVGDYLVETSGNKAYDASGLLLDFSPAIGVDVPLNSKGWFHMRLEGELGYNYYSEKGNIKNDNYVVTNEIKFKLNQFYFLGNGYADFRIDKVVPYIGFGLGYSFGKYETTINGDSESVNDNGILYAMHLGLAYKFSDITTFDLGCRRIYAPAEGDGKYVFDSIRLGLRFRI